MFYFEWTFTTIQNEIEWGKALQLIKEQPKTLAAFDTETTGLHIILDKPFLFQFGFVNEDTRKGYAFVIDLSKNLCFGIQVIQEWHTIAPLYKKYIGKNTKFDLHMLKNIGCEYTGTNVTDVEFLIRYAHDAKHVEEGGPPMELKKYAQMYIDKQASEPEKVLKHQQTEIAKEYNMKLRDVLASCGEPPAELAGKAKSYTLGVISEIFKDKIFEVNDLPYAIRDKYIQWRKELPLDIERNMTEGLVRSEDIPYYSVSRESLIYYAFYDVVYNLEIWHKVYPILRTRKNEIGLQYEEATIPALLKMERVGFKADKAYLENCRIKIRNYILKRRKDLRNQVGVVLKIGQHDRIKYVLQKKYGLDVQSTSNSELEILLNKMYRKKENLEAQEFIRTIQELRTLEKWYAVYVLRFQKDLKYTDRLYTQIHQVGTVSGRVTSDFQQFPKCAIYTSTGEELFHPRRIIEAENGLVYLDYSQIELRFQAMYTILVGHPDTNLCRAYMPYDCVNKDGVLFDYTNKEHLASWDKEWYYKEDPTKHWVPTDVHGATTTAATGLTPEDEEFKLARSKIGKRTNFAKNYGAQYKKICEMFPDKTPEECRKIDAAYYTAFPGVKEYHNYCYRIAMERAYSTNMFGVKYYGTSGHKLINILIQGSAAFFLKKKIKEIDDYLTNNNYKTKIQMQIHDELSFVYHPDDPIEIFFEIQKIMQTWDDALVPLVAEMEVTKTYWSEKKDVKTVEELRAYLKS